MIGTFTDIAADHPVPSRPILFADGNENGFLVFGAPDAEPAEHRSIGAPIEGPEDSPMIGYDTEGSRQAEPREGDTSRTQLLDSSGMTRGYP
jgi:hypothetical protein